VGEVIDFPNRGTHLTEWGGFYTASQVARLAGISVGALREWRNRGVIGPSFEMQDYRGLVIARGYSYADLTIVRLLRALRNGRLDLRSAVIALRHLYDRLGPPNKGWATANVYFVGGHVIIDKPDEWNLTDATSFGQKLEPRMFGDLFEELRDLEERESILIPARFRRFVEIDPEVLGGQPAIRDMRIPTKAIATLTKQGRSPAEIATLYEPVSEAAIQVALEYEQFLDRQAA
jgi:uncharacterized protein (DUF433 family)